MRTHCSTGAVAQLPARARSAYPTLSARQNHRPPNGAIDVWAFPGPGGWFVESTSRSQASGQVGSKKAKLQFIHFKCIE